MNDNENNSSMNNNYNAVNIKQYNQNINHNVEQDGTINQNIRQFENKMIMIVMTICVLIISIVGRWYSCGLITLIFTVMCPIFPIHFIAFTIAGVLLSNVKNKSKKDYMYFLTLCISMLIYSFTFVDSGVDTEHGVPDVVIYIFKGISTEIIKIIKSINKLALLINICFIILSIKRHNKKNSELHKQENIKNH